MFDVTKIREDFPILSRKVYDRPLVYLDNGATTQKPLCVLDAMREEYLNVNANVHRGVHYLSQQATDLHEQAREKVRKFINAGSVNEIIFTRGTTESLNLVVSSFCDGFMSEGDEVIVSVMEHHSNIVPWQLLAAPLPAALRGGLMVVSDRQAPAVEQPEPLARQLVRVCLRRGFSGIVLDLEELPEGRWAEDRAALIRQLAPLLTAYGRRLYVPEIYAAASPETVVLLCTALSGGSLQGRLEEACAAYGAQRLALDLERLMMDFPLPCPSGEGIRLSREELAIRLQGRSVFYAEDLCARYFTYRRGGQTHFVLFDDAGTLKRKMEMGQALGIREGFVMLPEVEDLTGFLFTGEG